MIHLLDHNLAKVYRQLPLGWQFHIERSYALMLSAGLARRGHFAQCAAEREATRFLSVVVPVHNSLPFVRQCIASLEKYCGYAEVIVVDDGSTDPEIIPYLREATDRNAWALVPRSGPGGHSAACQDGAKFATRPIMCLLNADTVLTHRSWAACVDALRADPRVGAVGPSTSFAGTRQQVLRARRCRHFWTTSQLEGFAAHYVQRRAAKPYVQIPDWLDGCALFVRQDSWTDVAGFRECRPHYGNDVDLSKKLLDAGYTLIWARTAYIHHFGGGSVGIARAAQNAQTKPQNDPGLESTVATQ